MVKAVIMDLNGIFIQSPRLSERFSDDFSIPVGVFLPKLSEIMSETRMPGAGPAFTYWKPVLAEWKVNLPEKEFWDYWFGAEKVSDQMVKFAKELKAKKIKVFILSNNFKERGEHYRHYPWMKDVIDKTYFSYETGHVKPDTRAWITLLAENDLEPSECLYFDDQEKNVRAAESIGITAHLFNGEDELIKVVKRAL